MYHDKYPLTLTYQGSYPSPSVRINDAATKRPIIPPQISLLTKINRELLLEVMIRTQSIVIVFVAIALVAAVGGFIIISNYVMPNIHQFCPSRLGTLHCYEVQNHKLF